MGRRRLRRLLAGATVVGAVVTAMACGSFSADTPPNSPEAGSDVTLATDDAAPRDAAPRDAAESSVPADIAACPASQGPTCLPSCARRTLHTPTVPAAYPFAITTDAQYVYWVEQTTPPGDGGPSLAYNGGADGRVLRVAKAGGATEILATDQPRAVAIAVDRGFVYWASHVPNQSTVWRVNVDCAAAGCPPPVSVAVGPPGERIDQLVRAAEGVLFLKGGGGSAFRLPAGPAQVLAPVGSATGEFAALSVATDAVYETGRTHPFVERIGIDGTSGLGLPIVPRDGGDPGFINSTSDCTNVWGVWGPGTKLYRFAPDGAVSALGTARNHGAYGMRADATFVYVAAENAGGVFAIDKTTGNETSLYAGNVWSVAVDTDGVYWGEHGGAQAGALYMLVK